MFLPRTLDSQDGPLPGARVVSRAISRAAFPIENNGERESAINSLYLMQVGQFIDHDLVHTAAQSGKSAL